MLLSDNDILHYMGNNDIFVSDNYGLHGCGIDLPVNINTGSLILKPGDFFLLKTKNKISLSDTIAGMLGGRSRYARKGLLIHCTSSLIAPGFSGHIVLEVKNVGNENIRIVDGEKICSLSFLKMFTACRNPYNGRYQNQMEAKV